MSRTIGKVSVMTGVLATTIRYYESEGLITVPERSIGGHRLYDADAVENLQFIRRSRELGFTLDEIRQLIDFSKGTQRCKDTHELAVQHLGDIKEKIRDLRHLQKALTSLTDQCGQTPKDECPIFDALQFGDR
jgi:MerR family mercuric resistance operon transcriptional regulator